MATKKIKKTRKLKPKQALRNAASVSAMPRPRAATQKASTDWGERGWQVAKLGGGMLAGALACAYIARQDWLPPKTITGAATAVGSALFVGGESETLRLLGAGAAAAAGGQLLLLTVDDQLRRTPELMASKDKAPPKKPANADGLPPGALEAAYERARRRLAMTQSDDVAA